MKRFLSGILCLASLASLGAEELSETVTGQVKETLNIKKISPTIPLKPEEIVDSGTMQTERVIRDSRPIPSEEDYAAFKFLDSEQIMKPWNALIPQPPLVTFYPGLSNVRSKRWEFRVSNNKGERVRLMAGRGVPPREFIWDGTDDKKEMIHVGALYSYQFVTFDENETTHTLPGEPFHVDALQFNKRGDLIIEFSGKALFKKGQSQFQESMIPFWNRALDILRENSSRALTLELDVDAPNDPLWDDRRKTLVNTLSNKLLMLPSDIRHRVGHFSDRVDVVRLIIGKK